MAEVINEIFSPSKKYKAQIIKRRDGLFTTEVSYWMEELGHEFWSPQHDGFTLIDSEESACKIAIEQLRSQSGEVIHMWFVNGRG